MTRLEKCELLKSKGYTYDAETGKVYGTSGKEIISKDNKGYIRIRKMGIMPGSLRIHHYAYYMTYGNVDFEMLDHINRDKTDNRISNLRIVNNQQNKENYEGKGCYLENNKWRAMIRVDKKLLHLGCFNTEEEARQAYLDAKLKYHKSFIHSNQ